MLACVVLPAALLRPLPAAAQSPAAQSPAAQSPAGGQLLDVAAELRRINDAHKEALLKAPGGTAERAALRAAADSSRDAALRDLVARAVAAKSPEHGALAQVYARLQQKEDALREARAALALRKDDHASHTLLVSLLCSDAKLDEAEKAFVAARGGLADPRYLAQPHHTLVTQLERAGRDDDLVRVTVFYLDALWTALSMKPDEITPFIETALNHLSQVGVRTKSAEKILPIFDKFERRLTEDSVAGETRAEIASALRSTKIRVLLAAGEQEAARKVAVEQVAVAEKRLAAEPKNRAAVLGVVFARQQKFLAVEKGKGADEYVRALNEFFEAHVDEHRESAEFLITFGNSISFATREMVKAGDFDAAEAWLKEWITRLEGLDLQSPEAKNYARGGSIRAELYRLDEQRKKRTPVR
jgi:hypothetical protein